MLATGYCLAPLIRGACGRLWWRWYNGGGFSRVWDDAVERRKIGCHPPVVWPWLNSNSRARGRARNCRSGGSRGDVVPSVITVDSISCRPFRALVMWGGCSMGSRPWLHHAAPIGAEWRLAISCRPGNMVWQAGAANMAAQIWCHPNMVPSTCPSKAMPDGRWLVQFRVVCNPFRVG